MNLIQQRHVHVSAEIVASIHPNVNAFLSVPTSTSTSTSTNKIELNPRIVGGDIVNPPNRYPFMVSVDYLPRSDFNIC